MQVTLTQFKRPKILVHLIKNLMLLLFFILPSRLARVFISLSILAMIYDVKHYNYQDHPVNKDQFNRLLRLTFDEEIMMLPTYTMRWLWEDNFLDSQIKVNGNYLSLKHAITSKTVFATHKCVIVNKFLVDAPPLIKLKLGLMDRVNRVAIKNNVVNLLGSA